MSSYKCLLPLPSSQLDTSLDGDNPEHIQWVFEKSQERAAEFNITGVTYRLTQGETVNYKILIHAVVICHTTSYF